MSASSLPGKALVVAEAAAKEVVTVVVVTAVEVTAVAMEVAAQAVGTAAEKEAATVVVATAVATAERRSPRPRNSVQRAVRSSYHTDSPQRIRRWPRRASLA